MSRLSRISIVVMTAVVFLCSCRQKEGRIIPRSTMSKIYADMLMTDEWILARRSLNRQADTSLVYEPIFRNYGYTSDDFRASRAYYLNDAERYSRILKKTSEMLQKRLKEAKKEKEILDAQKALEENKKYFIPEKIYSLSGMYDKETFVEDSVKFYVDTTGSAWTFDPAKDIDTLYDGPMLVIPEAVDTVAVESDTVAVEPIAVEEPANPESITEQKPVKLSNHKPEGPARAPRGPKAKNDTAQADVAI